jgi:hypothetical protein
MPTASFYDAMFKPWRRTIFFDLLRDSAHVVNVRTRKIVEASTNPLSGDYAELSRMVPEKMEAFSDAGSVLSAEFIALQKDVLTSWSDMMGLALRPRFPTLVEANAMTARASAMFTKATGAGDKALLPIARKARSNARRLK